MHGWLIAVQFPVTVLFYTCVLFSVRYVRVEQLVVCRVGATTHVTYIK